MPFIHTDSVGDDEPDERSVRSPSCIQEKIRVKQILIPLSEIPDQGPGRHILRAALVKPTSYDAAGTKFLHTTTHQSP